LPQASLQRGSGSTGRPRQRGSQLPLARPYSPALAEEPKLQSEHKFQGYPSFKRATLLQRVARAFKNRPDDRRPCGGGALPGYTTSAADLDGDGSQTARADGREPASGSRVRIA